MFNSNYLSIDKDNETLTRLLCKNCIAVFTLLKKCGLLMLRPRSIAFKKKLALHYIDLVLILILNTIDLPAYLPIKLPVMQVTLYHL